MVIFQNFPLGIITGREMNGSFLVTFVPISSCIILENVENSRGRKSFIIPFKCKCENFCMIYRSTSVADKNEIIVITRVTIDFCQGSFYIIFFNPHSSPTRQIFLFSLCKCGNWGHEGYPRVFKSLHLILKSVFLIWADRQN